MSGLWIIVDTGVSYLDQPEEFLLVIIIVTLFNDHAVAIGLTNFPWLIQPSDHLTLVILRIELTRVSWSYL